MFTNKFWLVMSLVILVVTFISPLHTQALTMDEITPGNSINSQGRVLGTMTPSPDINGDGRVNSLDAAILIIHMGQKYPPADLNSDGVVNSLDLSILSAWWFAVK